MAIAEKVTEKVWRNWRFDNREEDKENSYMTRSSENTSFNNMSFQSNNVTKIINNSGDDSKSQGSWIDELQRLQLKRKRII